MKKTKAQTKPGKKPASKFFSDLTRSMKQANEIVSGKRKRFRKFHVP